MVKKLAIITLSAILLGGCTLTDAFKTGDAAQDIKSEVVATSTPAPASPDPELGAMPSTSALSDDKSLETDLDNTKILDEYFSDLQ